MPRLPNMSVEFPKRQSVQPICVFVESVHQFPGEIALLQVVLELKRAGWLDAGGARVFIAKMLGNRSIQFCPKGRMEFRVCAERKIRKGHDTSQPLFRERVSSDERSRPQPPLSGCLKTASIVRLLPQVTEWRPHVHPARPLFERPARSWPAG